MDYEANRERFRYSKLLPAMYTDRKWSPSGRYLKLWRHRLMLGTRRQPKQGRGGNQVPTIYERRGSQAERWERTENSV